MACALSQGYTLGCRDNAGGVLWMALANLGNVSGITSVSGVVTAITMAPGTKFYKYEQFKDTSEAKDEYQGDLIAGTGFFNQTVDLSIPKMQTSIRNEIVVIAQTNVAAIVLDRNGKYWLYGETNGLTMGTGIQGTGKAMGDKNGYTISLVGGEPQPAKEVTAGIVAALLV